MTTRYVLYSKVRGVYLGNAIGLGFWSNWEAAGQTHAVTFASEQEVSDHISLFPVVKEPWYPEAIVVEVANPPYATMEECVKAGLPEWKP